MLFSSAPTATIERSPAGERQRQRRVPARAPDREGGANDGVLAAAVDRPVVCEEGVGDPAQPRPSLAVLERDRLVGDVPARQHERTADVGREQVVERRVREHDAEPRRARRDRRGDRGVVPPRAGARSAARASAAAPTPAAETSHSSSGAAVITANGFSSRRLRARSRATAVLVRGVAGQVVAAQALDGEDRSRAQQRDRLLERHREPRPAGGTCDRLRVEAPVGRVLVLAAAVGAHREAGHRRVRPVVGNRPHDREAGPALRAVDERVAVAAVGRVEELAQAVVARGHVRRNDRRAARSRRLAAIAKRSSPRGRSDSAVTVSTRASAGASARSEAAKESSDAASPSASITTPSPSFEHEAGEPVLRPASR